MSIQSLHRSPRRGQRRPEQQIQRALVRHLEWRAPKDVWFCHVPNGGYRRPVEAAILKALGVRAGTPDLLILKYGHLFALEQKALGGRLSEEQRMCAADLRRAGATVAVATGIDEAIEVLTSWGVLPGGAP